VVKRNSTDRDQAKRLLKQQLNSLSVLMIFKDKLDIVQHQVDDGILMLNLNILTPISDQVVNLRLYSPLTN